ncbi:hypothetical protein MO973_15085 [Paenibacillus sp. TRM 82003]|uniref:hypothetical protein n=1 Tax=Kineococcus sp. TRM81007 TaxID=2925831 RepID=UPI001F57AFCD|nr:hypothetical protein [Kineococcus sp. TRM81007]MCI2238586.1 hypothetical protein [Kineococcus sp. TRM81007]MCI3921557.1 hypothetical protein [Paenibacillus sp. TRM 82003]
MNPHVTRLAATLPAAALAAVALTACSGTSPCAELPVPTAEQVAAASQEVRGLPVEVEVEHEGVDCFVDPTTRRWTEEAEETES